MAISTGERFEATLAKVRQEIADHLHEIGLMPEAVDRVTQVCTMLKRLKTLFASLTFGKCLFTNTSGGNQLRGRSVLDTGSILNGHDLTTTQIEELLVLGSLIEFFHAAYVVWDDIMDGSTTRRGQPCWYCRESVGMAAINDACLLKSVIGVILKKRFRDHPAYVDFIELFSEASLRTELGQHCDLMASTNLLRLDQFNWDKYDFITANKTAYYSVYVPLTIPHLYLGLATPKKLGKLYEVSMMFGLICQARDDVLDVYGDPLDTGKIGTDIQENKCTWLSVEALQHCDVEQKRVLENCYGSQEREDILKVQAVFEELNLVKLFGNWDKEMLAKLDTVIEQVSKEAGLKKEIFSGLVSKYFADPRKSLPWSGNGP
ncbi:hypothetical protein V502_02934 [Pseudogymnoascus sp. VKM F-4520 (FW-2644)]|nr:hypothetical protein V502_02934 [Pseudogymnoascus sp. VKM F-4520 (FW-2644)]